MNKGVISDQEKAERKMIMGKIFCKQMSDMNFKIV